MSSTFQPADSNSPSQFQGQPAALVDRVVNLLNPAGDILLNRTREQAHAAVRSGNADAVRAIMGQFAICEQSGKTIRMARSIGRPMRYFLAKRVEGPALIIAERIDEIAAQLESEGLADQFNPAYTRMVPAHHLLELQLVGCPDPNPTLTRFFAPARNRLPADVAAVGEAYIGRLAEVCDAWLETLPEDEPIGVLFSGGIDSGCVLVVLDHLIRRRGQSPSRLKAFTLSVTDGTRSINSADVDQAQRFLEALGLPMYLEPIEVPIETVSWRNAIKIVEDYKPLDIESATMACALLAEVRRRYPDWIHLVDGDGGDENLKDYPIEDNPELTIKSVLGNRMLYQEGWGVHAVKHSQVYSGGQSRGHARTSAPAAKFGFSGFSPFATPQVIEVAEAIPFVDLTAWDHERLYALKGDVVAAGVKAITGIQMPVFPKRRFQHGAVDDKISNLCSPTTLRNTAMPSLKFIASARLIAFALVAAACHISIADEPASVSPTLVSPASVSLTRGDDVVATYLAATQIAPDPAKPWFSRSGFIHPFRTPNGIAVTSDFPTAHEHQHALMFAWTSSYIEGRYVNFWDNAMLVGRIEHEAIVSADADKIVAKLRHVELPATKEGTERVAISETWEINRVDHPSMNVIDLVSRQRNVLPIPIVIKKYHYGGMCIRGPNPWMTSDAKIATDMTLQSDDEASDPDIELASREQGNHSRPRYAVMYGEIDGQACGIAAFSHPSNFRAPQPVRIHPTEPYFCFSPMVLGEFELAPQTPYVSAFRFAAFDGVPDRETLESMADTFAELKIEPSR